MITTNVINLDDKFCSVRLKYKKGQILIVIAWNSLTALSFSYVWGEEMTCCDFTQRATVIQVTPVAIET